MVATGDRADQPRRTSQPRSDSEASCSAATQPSVGAELHVVGGQVQPAQVDQKCRDSAVSKRSAVKSISTSSSCTRIRLIGRPARLRLVTTTCKLAAARARAGSPAHRRWRGGHPMPVVDHQRDARPLGVDLVDQRRQHVGLGVFAVVLEHLTQLGARVGCDPPDRLDQVRRGTTRRCCRRGRRSATPPPRHRAASAGAPLRGQRASCRIRRARESP